MDGVALSSYRFCLFVACLVHIRAKTKTEEVILGGLCGYAPVPLASMHGPRKTPPWIGYETRQTNISEKRLGKAQVKREFEFHSQIHPYRLVNLYCSIHHQQDSSPCARTPWSDVRDLGTSRCDVVIIYFDLV